MTTPKPIYFPCGCAYRDEDTDGEFSWSYIMNNSQCTNTENPPHADGLITMKASALDYGGTHDKPAAKPAT